MASVNYCSRPQKKKKLEQSPALALWSKILINQGYLKTLHSTAHKVDTFATFGFSFEFIVLQELRDMISVMSKCPYNMTMNSPISKEKNI